MIGQGQYDVVVVGASLAGCTAAILFGRAGLKVALVEREAKPNAYKKICTHLIQSHATSVIERLGLLQPIEAAGGIRQTIEMWTQAGWIREPWTPKERPRYGYNLRREKLDPLLRDLAVSTAGVDFMPGHSVREILVEDERPVGVATASIGESGYAVRGRLIVAADGRHSRTAALAGVTGKIASNGRFSYSAYYSDLPLESERTSLIYFLDPDWASILRTDGGLVLLGAMPVKESLPAWKSDLEGSFLRYFEALPDAPPLRQAKRVSPILGMLDMPSIWRPAVCRGIAFVGDAAFAADPLWGVGCGFALQTGEWLVDEVAGALREGGKEDLDSALERYRKRHQLELRGHRQVMENYATGRRFNRMETALYSAAAQDASCAADFLAFTTRNKRPEELLARGAVRRHLRRVPVDPISNARFERGTTLLTLPGDAAPGGGHG